MPPTTLIQNPLLKIFLENKIIEQENIEYYFYGTRDIDEINVMLDRCSGGLFTDKIVNNLNEYYQNNILYSQDGLTLLQSEKIFTTPLEDDIRRYDATKNFLVDKKILDFGCGKGGLLKLLKDNKISNDLFGVELNNINRRNLLSNNIHCYENIEMIIEKDFDFIFMNHVFEHITDPITILQKLLSILKSDGHIIIEIPHGDDFLIKKSGIDEFKKFTFWSEHVCLYTKKLIEKLLSVLHIANYQIAYFQRYGINNHFHWFKERLPGGHVSSKIFSDHFDLKYKELLVSEQIADTMFITIGSNCRAISKSILYP